MRISAHPNKSAVGSDSSAPRSGVRSTPEQGQSSQWQSYKKCLKEKNCYSANFKKISIKSNLEKAIQKALGGDEADLQKFNQHTRASWQSVIVGKTGDPLTVLRLTIEGIAGDEQSIE